MSVECLPNHIHFLFLTRFYPFCYPVLRGTLTKPEAFNHHELPVNSRLRINYALRKVHFSHWFYLEYDSKF